MRKPPRLSLLGNRVSTAAPRITARPKTADPYYSTEQHRAWRLAVCRAASWRCEAIENGQRCEKSAIAFPKHVSSRMVKKLRLLKGGSVPTFLVLGRCCTTSLPWMLE